MYAGYRDDDRIDSQWLMDELLGLNLNFDLPTVVLVEPACEALGGNAWQRNYSKVRNLLEMNLKDSAVVFATNNGRLGLIFTGQSREALVERVNELVTNQVSTGITIGVGQPAKTIEELGYSYRQAEEALKRKFYMGRGKIIYFHEDQANQALVSFCEYPSVRESELFECIKGECSQQEIEHKVDLLYEFIMKNGLLEIKMVFEVTIRILTGLEKRMAAELELESFPMNYEISAVLQLETLQEIKNYLVTFATDMREQLALRNKGSHRSVITKTIRYMEEECKNASLHSVAQQVYMTPSYLSLLFKMTTGKTFIEQLTDIRIDKAKHILKNTHLKNYEVAEKVGYQDPRYFGQIFKKKVGLSPSEYREIVGK